MDLQTIPCASIPMPNGDVKGSGLAEGIIFVCRAWQHQGLVEHGVRGRSMHRGPLHHSVASGPLQTGLNVGVDRSLAGPSKVLATNNCTKQHTFVFSKFPFFPKINFSKTICLSLKMALGLRWVWVIGIDWVIRKVNKSMPNYKLWRIQLEWCDRSERRRVGVW